MMMKRKPTTSHAVLTLLSGKTVKALLSMCFLSLPITIDHWCLTFELVFTIIWFYIGFFYYLFVALYRFRSIVKEGVLFSQALKVWWFQAEWVAAIAILPLLLLEPQVLHETSDSSDGEVKIHHGALLSALLLLLFLIAITVLLITAAGTFLVSKNFLVCSDFLLLALNVDLSLKVFCLIGGGGIFCSLIGLTRSLKGMDVSAKWGLL